jgi:hypothetical protein
MLFSSILNRLQKTPVKLILKEGSTLEDGSPIGGSPAPLPILEIPAAFLEGGSNPDSGYFPELIPYISESITGSDTTPMFHTFYEFVLNGAAVFSNFRGIRIVGNLSSTFQNDSTLKYIKFNIKLPVGHPNTITSTGELSANTGLKLNSEGNIDFFFEAGILSSKPIELRIEGSPLYNSTVGQYGSAILDTTVMSPSSAALSAHYVFNTKTQNPDSPFSGWLPTVVKSLDERVKPNVTTPVNMSVSQNFSFAITELEPIKRERIKLRKETTSSIPSFVAYDILSHNTQAVSTLTKFTEMVVIDLMSVYLNTTSAPTEIALGTVACSADTAFTAPMKDIATFTLSTNTGNERVAFIQLMNGLQNFIYDPANNRGKRMFLNIRGITAFTELEVGMTFERIDLFNK